MGRFLEQQANLKGSEPISLPQLGPTLEIFLQKRKRKLIYGLPYRHTTTELVERGENVSKEMLSTKTEAEKN